MSAREEISENFEEIQEKLEKSEFFREKLEIEVARLNAEYSRLKTEMFKELGCFSKTFWVLFFIYIVPSVLCTLRLESDLLCPTYYTTMVGQRKLLSSARIYARINKIDGTLYHLAHE